MLSSLGLDTRTLSRGTRSGASKYFDMPRGLAVHVFKNPPPPTALAPSYHSTSKGQSDQDRSNDNTRSQSERKLSSSPTDPLRISQPAVYVDPKRAKSSRGRDPYLYSSLDTYVYGSFPAAPDALATSPSSSSSDSDIFSDSAVSASIEISSTRASSSTETLETIALAIPHPASASEGRPPHPRLGSSSDWSRITPDGARILPPGLHPISRNASNRATFSNPGAWLSLDDAASDTDDDTYVDDDEFPMLAITRDDSRHPRRAGPPPGPPPPARRYSDERPMIQELPVQRLNSGGMRGAPGPMRASDNRNPPSVSTNRVDNVIEDGRRAHLLRANTVPMVSGNHPSRIMDKPAVMAPPSVSQPKAEDGRRGDAQAPTMTRSASTSGGMLTVATRRGVRWTEDLMCPCPVPRSERRKGWYNRRGDQLWTNDGRFRPPEPGREYPPDLVGYPEPSAGWMNEEGVRIDMEHCLIPKPPLRSVLKRPKTGAGNQ